MNKQIAISKIISIDSLDVSFTSLEEGKHDRKDGIGKVTGLDGSDNTARSSSNRSNLSLWNRSNPNSGEPSEIDEGANEEKDKTKEIETKTVVTIRNMKRGILFYLLLLFFMLVGSIIIKKIDIFKKGMFFSGISFQKDAEMVFDGIRTNLYSALGATDAFVVSMIAQAKGTKQTFPFVTIDDFDLQAERLLARSRAKYISTYPVIKEEQYQEWMEYATNHSSWLEQSMMYKTHASKSNVGWPNNTSELGSSGRYLSKWQYAPVISTDVLDNCGFATNEKYQGPSVTTIEEQMITITEPYFSNWPDDIEHQQYNDQQGKLSSHLKCDEDHTEPVFELYYPVFDTLRSIRNHESDNNLAAYLRLTISWRDILRDVLPPMSHGVVAVIENPCGNNMTFELTSDVPKYLEMAKDELGHSYFSIYEHKLGFGETSYTGIPTKESCPYTISFYPTESRLSYLIKEVKKIYGDAPRTNPGGFVMMVLAVVMILALLPITYFFRFSGRLHQEEIQASRDLLEAKRNFVRFISHEVRTPLNVVCMGLALILQEIKIREKELQNKKGDDEDENRHKDTVTEKKNLIRWSCMTQEVSSSIDVAVGVLNDLLNIDKIQMGSFKFEMEVLPVWELIEDTTSEFKMMAERQNTNLKLDFSSLHNSVDIEPGNTHTSMLPPSILKKKVVGDNQRLRQVLRNLLSNAIKFSENRSVTVKTSCTGIKSHRFYSDDKNIRNATTEFELADGIRKSFPRSGRIVVDVVDTGVGMTPFELEKVFNMGTQFNAKKSQAGGGSGLGLTFSKAIVEQLGGSLRAFSSGRDKGTTMRLELPLYISDSDCCSVEDVSEEIVFVPMSPTSTEESAKAAPKKISLRPSRQRHRKAERRHLNPEDPKDLEPLNILVVDDDPMNSKFMVRLLESYGHVCQRLKNGQELVDAISEDTIGYDCILLDYEMPIMNGPEACRSIREIGKTNFVVGVTGNLLPEDIGHFMECGADDVLPKPLKYDELKELLIEYGIGIPIDSNSGHFEATTAPRRSSGAEVQCE